MQVILLFWFAAELQSDTFRRLNYDSFTQHLKQNWLSLAPDSKANWKWLKK